MVHRAAVAITFKCAAVVGAAGVAVGAGACDRAASSTVATNPSVVAGGTVDSYACGLAVGSVAGMVAPVAVAGDFTVIGLRATVIVARATYTVTVDVAAAVVGAAGVAVGARAYDRVTGSTVAARPRVGAGVTVDSYARSLTVGSVASMLAPIALAGEHAIVGSLATVTVERAT